MNKRLNWVSGAIGLLLGTVCALVLAAVFYGTMAYQLADGPAQQAALEGSADALLVLPGAQLLSEQTAQQEMGGILCTVTSRLYQLESGAQAEALSARPAAYIERLAAEGWTAQLMTGFTLAGLDAVYSVRAGEGMLSARSGERIYMLRAPADEQGIYTLGAQACLE